MKAFKTCVSNGITSRFLITTGVLLVLCVLETGVGAFWNLGMDADARFAMMEKGKTDAEFHVMGISLRKTLSDSEGDRLILFALFEAHDDLSERMLHEVYARYKGPMGRWNVTAGRFGLPFGLLTDFTASRFLFEDLYAFTTGMTVDSGIMLSGVVGDMDYGLALTQGYGGHATPEAELPDIVSGRAGWTFGDSGDVRLGLSALSGRTRSQGHGHHAEYRQQRNIAAVDLTAQPGRWLTRLEIQAGEIENQSVIGAFGMCDYAWKPRWDITVAGRVIHHQQKTTGFGYVGAGYRSPWFTIRGGYVCEYDDQTKHSFSLQIYRMVSIPFLSRSLLASAECIFYKSFSVFSDGSGCIFVCLAKSGADDDAYFSGCEGLSDCHDSA